VTEAARGAVVTHAQGRTEGKLVIACAGLGSDRLAQASGGDPEPRIVPIRGAYYRLRRPELCRTLIYPVPDPRLPFLGVHLTRRVGGDVVLGPTALLVGARDAYALTRVRRRDLGDTLRWPGTYKFIRRWWRHAAEELTYAVSREAYAKAVRRLVPEVRAEDLEPSFAGIRAQALDREGKLLDDFAFTSSEHTLHVRNAPSPAATSSLAIAAHLADHVGWAAA
jgi:2-hydroxyglutarate dehydrogenase